MNRETSTGHASVALKKVKDCRYYAVDDGTLLGIEALLSEAIYHSTKPTQNQNEMHQNDYDFFDI
jgi:hypothetical protein